MGRKQIRTRETYNAYTAKYITEHPKKCDKIVQNIYSHKNGKFHKLFEILKTIKLSSTCRAH